MRVIVPFLVGLLLTPAALAQDSFWAPGQRERAGGIAARNAGTPNKAFATVYGRSRDVSATTDTLSVSDCGKTIFYSSNSAVTVTIPASIVPADGTVCIISIVQVGTAKDSVNGTAVAAATLVSASSYTGTSGTAGSVIDLILTTTAAGTTTAYLTGNGS